MATWGGRVGVHEGWETWEKEREGQTDGQTDGHEEQRIVGLKYPVVAGRRGQQQGSPCPPCRL